MNRKNFHTIIRIKVFNPGNQKSTRRNFTAKPGHHWDDKGVDEILDWIANDLEKRFPAEEYRMIQVGPGAYNFIHAGTRPIEVSEESKQLAEESFQGMIGGLAKQLEKDEGGS